MSDLKSETQALLDLGRWGDDPSDEEVALSRRRLAARVGAAALGAGVVATSTAPAAAAPAVSAWASTKVMALCGAVLAGGAAYGTYELVKAEPASQPVMSASPASSASSQKLARLDRKAEPAPEVAQPRPEVIPSASAPAPSPAAPSTSAVKARSIQDELRLIRAAQQHIHRNESRAALALLAEHGRRYPSGALAEEREASRAIALCQQGDVAAARKQAKRFVERSPNSPLVDRVRTPCSAKAR
jgi:TolA-binding protein